MGRDGADHSRAFERPSAVRSMSNGSGHFDGPSGSTRGMSFSTPGLVAAATESHYRRPTCPFCARGIGEHQRFVPNRHTRQAYTQLALLFIPDANVASKSQTLFDMDLLPRIKGMYRLLELFTEQGSGGVVDKIIISQDSVSELVEELCPGAYSSLTKV